MSEQQTSQPPVRRKARKPKKRRLRRAFLALLLLLMVVVSGAAAWVATGPHSVAWVKDRVLASLNAKPDLFRVEVEDVVVQFGGWSDPIAIHAVNSTVILPGGQLFTSVPDIAIGADVGALLTGELKLDTVHIRAPSIYLHRSADGMIMIGNNEGGAGQTAPLDRLLAGLAMQGSDGSEVAYPDVSIEDATLRIYSESLGDSLDITDAYIALERQDDQYRLAARLPVDYEQRFTLQLSGEYALSSDIYSLSARYDALPISFICLWGDYCEGIEPLAATFEGRVDVTHNAGKPQPRIAFEAQTKDARFGKADWFEEPLTFLRLHARGSVDLAAKELHLAELSGVSEEFPFKADGQILFAEDAPTVLLNAELSDVSVDKVAKYWPHSLAPGTRQWVDTHITKGHVPHAQIALKIEPHHHEMEFFPAETLSAHVQVENAQLSALDGVVPFEELDASVHFTGDAMTATGKAARLGNLAIRDLTIEMPNLNDPAVPTKAMFGYSGALPDAISLLASKPFTFDDHLGLSSKAAKGTAEGTMALSFNAFSEAKGGKVDWDAVQYDVQAQLADVFYPDFMGKADIGDFAGKVTASNALFSVEGAGRVDGTSLSGALNKKAGKPTEYDVKGMVTGQLLTRYGLSVGDYVSGALELDAHIVDTAIFPTITAKLDASKAQLKVDELFWEKPAGKAAQLTLSAKPDGKQHRAIVNAQLDAANMQADAVVNYDLRDNALRNLALSKLIFDENNVSVTYQPLKNGEFVEVKGVSLNLRPHLAQEGKQSISRFPPLHLIADVQRVYLANDKVFSDVKGKLFCTYERCHSADFQANMDDGKRSTLRIQRNSDGLRELKLTADDAGQWLKALDLVDSMQAGVLEITGTYDDTRKGNPFSGRFLITDFVLRDAPVLGKILNLASLTGLFDTLAGKGMRFDKLSSYLHFVDDTATLSDAIMKGASVGVTADGTAHLGDAKLAMEGTVIPAYALNSLIGEIPVLGELITGGENQGVLGVDYSVSGSYEDPEISVNPLSAFTPGFLRNIFDIFDAPEGEARTYPEGRAAPVR